MLVLVVLELQTKAMLVATALAAQTQIT